MEDETILVIEDDRDVAQLLGTALAMQHFTPVLVDDGRWGSCDFWRCAILPLKGTIAAKPRGRTRPRKFTVT